MRSQHGVAGGTDGRSVGSRAVGGGGIEMDRHTDTGQGKRRRCIQSRGWVRPNLPLPPLANQDSGHWPPVSGSTRATSSKDRPQASRPGRTHTPPPMDSRATPLPPPGSGTRPRARHFPAATKQRFEATLNLQTNLVFSSIHHCHWLLIQYVLCGLTWTSYTENASPSTRYLPTLYSGRNLENATGQQRGIEWGDA